MKALHILCLGLGLSLAACTDLDRYPLDEGSSETWYSTPSEYETAVNDMYRPTWWPLAKEAWSDDYIYRKVAGPDIVDGTLNSETNTDGSVQLYTFWTNQYKAIVRANAVISSLPRGHECGLSDAQLTSYEAQARFCRAAHYAILAFHFGDVVYVDKGITIEESYNMKPLPRAEIVAKVYDDFDFAIAHLPASYAGKQLATRGAALALKARYALYFGDYAIAAEAAKECYESGVYRLAPDYGEYFHARNDKESIFVLPASSALGIGTLGDSRSYVTRLPGGLASKCPSWALFATYECTDGLTIDKSPLFDPQNPFENRDPRCKASLVEFGTEHLGFEFNPRPSATKVMNYTTGVKQANKDNYPVGNANASFSGLVWKKKVEASWVIGGETDNDNVFIRLADVYLIYAEAMIEQGKVDDSVLHAINMVRARAYGVGVDATGSYPAVTTTNTADLRQIVRRERRVEFAFEGLRYYDLIRWRLAKKALNMPNCGMKSDKSTAQKLEKQGLWFWGNYTPVIGTDGIPSFQEHIDAGICDIHSTGNFSDRMYLWPIPAKELLLNKNLKQNEGY